MTKDDITTIMKLLSIPLIGFIAWLMFDGSGTSRIIIGLMAAGITYCVHAINGVEDSLLDAISARHKLHEVDRETVERNIAYIHDRLGRIEDRLTKSRIE
jgi:hypothetical protein